MPRHLPLSLLIAGCGAVRSAAPDPEPLRVGLTALVSETLDVRRASGLNVRPGVLGTVIHGGVPFSEGWRA